MHGHMIVKDMRVIYVEIKCQLDAIEVFIADLIACSTCFGHHYAHHHELKSIIQCSCLWYFVLWFSSCWSGVELWAQRHKESNGWAICQE